ncbi:hypothetical protein PAHAL_2G248700 [Panicum hallii]|uniref:Uncharacterized protein n=1 Tax=Panicum hallii TaxID=206008 RepID=A0A2T8KQC5_9POAL|nr:hypothetical protein PAHAL_2G248700 [Panicum hallii]
MARRQWSWSSGGVAVAAVLGLLFVLCAGHPVPGGHGGGGFPLQPHLLRAHVPAGAGHRGEGARGGPAHGGVVLAADELPRLLRAGVRRLRAARRRRQQQVCHGEAVQHQQ